MPSAKRSQALPWAVYPLYTIVFIDVLGYTFLIPLLPALQKHFAAPSYMMGALISVTAACATISSPLWGYLSDKVGRKSVLMSSQGFTLGGYVLIALAGNIPMLFASRIVAGLGGGNLGVAQSYIVDVVREDQRERALAWGTAAFGLGFVVGPVLSGLLLKFGLSAPFWAAAALEAINVVFTLFFLPRSQPQASSEHRRGLLHEFVRRPMLSLLTQQFLYIFSFTYFFTCFGLYLDRQLRVGASGAAFLLGAAGAVGAAVLIFGVDPLSKRFGAVALTQAAFLVAFVSYALLGFVTSLGLFAVMLVLWAASGSALRPTLSKLIADKAPGERRGAVLGFADSLNNLSMIFAPAMASTIVGLNPRLSGIIPALCAAGGFVVGALARRTER
jgi:MFS family permease